MPGKNYRLTLSTPKGSVVRSDDHALAVHVEAKQKGVGLAPVGSLRVMWGEIFWESSDGTRHVLWKGQEVWKKGSTERLIS
jgi:hypothetical protein